MLAKQRVSAVVENVVAIVEDQLRLVGKIEGVIVTSKQSRKAQPLHNEVCPLHLYLVPNIAHSVLSSSSEQ